MLIDHRGPILPDFGLGGDAVATGGSPFLANGMTHLPGRPGPFFAEPPIVGWDHTIYWALEAT
jgi:hypothetical protein